MPDNYIESDAFHERVEAVYNDEVQQNLIERAWFTKVDALDMFTEHVAHDRGLEYMPTHSVYKPVVHNIMPRPKLWRRHDDEKEDFTYRPADGGHYAPGIYNTNLSPTGWTPAIGKGEATHLEE